MNAGATMALAVDVDGLPAGTAVRIIESGCGRTVLVEVLGHGYDLWVHRAWLTAC